MASTNQCSCILARSQKSRNSLTSSPKIAEMGVPLRKTGKCSSSEVVKTEHISVIEIALFWDSTSVRRLSLTLNIQLAQRYNNHSKIQCHGWSPVDGSCSKSFWDSPLVEGSAGQVYPKTTTFCPVLGFAPSRQPSRAHQSQNDLEQRYSGTLCGGMPSKRLHLKEGSFWECARSHPSRRNRGFRLEYYRKLWKSHSNFDYFIVFD